MFLPPYTPNTITNGENLKAEMAGIHEQGYAIDNEEIESGIRCVGAPVRDSTGRIFAAVSVSDPVEHMPDIRMKGLVPAVIETANRIPEILARHKETPFMLGNRLFCKKVACTS